MNLPRYLTNVLADELNQTKVLVLYGARQVGKTTLIRQILASTDRSSIQVVGEEDRVANAFSSNNLQVMLQVIGDHQILFIDEAQVIPGIGRNIKILHDARPDLKIILTGSSSFDLANRTREALTGRTVTYQLHPVAVSELLIEKTPFQVIEELNQLLIYGTYPEVLTISDPSKKKDHLKELTQAYLYKDVLQLTTIKHSKLLHQLLKLVALQIGGLVSIQELSKNLKISFETVKSYLEMLEQAFVIRLVSGFSKNPRKEISKMDKIYFVDTGIRNAIINNFSPLDERNDTGALWENYLFMERTKYLAYTRDHATQYFWRKYSGSEIDYIEEKDAHVSGFEFKWGKKKSRAAHSWQTDYPEASYQSINRENFIDFLRISSREIDV